MSRTDLTRARNIVVGAVNRGDSSPSVGQDVIMDGSDAEIERLARDVAVAHGARWLSIIFAPEDHHRPWSVSIDEGRAGDATTAHAATLVEALRMRLAT